MERSGSDFWTRTILPRFFDTKSGGQPATTATTATTTATTATTAIRAAAGGVAALAGNDLPLNVALAEASATYETLLAMQRDPHVAACLLTRQNAVLSRGEPVVVGGAHESVRRTLSARLAALNSGAVPAACDGGGGGGGGGLLSVLAGALDALAMGWAVAELVENNAASDRAPDRASDRTSDRASDRAPVGRPTGVVPVVRSLQWHDVRRFGRTTGGDIILRETGETLPRERFIAFVYRPRWREPYGRSALLPALEAWRRKQRKQSLWMAALERHGLPTPVATVPEHWPPARRQQLADALAGLSADGALVVEAGVAIALPLDNRAGNPAHAGFAESIEMENREIARAILGQELTVQSSGGGERSLALAQVQERTAQMWHDALSSALLSDFLGPLCARLQCDLPPGERAWVAWATAPPVPEKIAQCGESPNALGA